MARPTPPPDETEGLLASLDDLGARIEAARRSPGVGAGGRGLGRLRWVLGLAVLTVLVLAGGLALGGGGGEGDVAAGARATQATETTVAPTTTIAPTSLPAPEDEVPAPAQDLPSDPDGPETTRTVAAGDSFWTIAEDVVGERLGRAPTDAEVTPLWVELVAANADRLVEPGNPNLILPGQVLMLPATAASP